MTNEHMTDDEICAEIAKMKLAPWSGWTPWFLMASVLGILQYWVYPTENSTATVGAIQFSNKMTSVKPLTAKQVGPEAK